MATGASASNSKQFRLPVSGITLTLSEGDIMNASAVAMATGEDNELKGQGGVTRLLLKSCPKSYRSSRDRLIGQTRKFEFGHVYPCTFPNSPDKGQASISFNTVFHAIVPSAKVVTKEKEWKDQMKGLYYRLFKAAEQYGKSSLALPLLGSGGAGASVDVAVDVLVHALVTFSPDNKAAARGHGLKDLVVYVRKEAFGKMAAQLQVKLPNGVITHTSMRQAPAGKEKSTPASSTRLPSARSGLTKSKTGVTKASSAVGGPTKKKSDAKPGAKRTAAKNTTKPVTRPEDEDSNMSLILNGMTLEQDMKLKDRSSLDQEEKEDMEQGDDLTYEDEEEEEEEEEEKEEEEEEEDDVCAICLDVMDNPKKLHKCSHTFCTSCIEDSFKHHKPACPTCNTVYGMITGTQPPGTMEVTRTRDGALPGYLNCGIIVIDYSFPSGIQGPEHPNPGQQYSGTRRRAFLPDCPEGNKVYRLLQVAFDNRLTFTIGSSRTTGADNVVTWNDIHHKTSIHGGPTHFGYPDPHYLSRVQEELAVKGVTEDCF